MNTLSLNYKGREPTRHKLVSLDFGEEDKRWQSTNGRQINREILPMLQGISQSSLSNGLGEMIRSWMCFGVVCFVRDFHPPPTVLFRALMHTYASLGNHCHICPVLKPMAFDPESDTLREEEATAGQGSVYDCRGLGWGWSWKESCAKVCDVTVMWKYYELCRWIDERDMFPVYKLKRLQKAEGLLWRHR